jgi:tRNA pseudouridine13 synthase
MKLKVTPEDFRVDEISEVPLSRRKGAYAVYRLTKRSWDTFDLVALLARRLGVSREDVSVGGMKDRHGETTQLVSVRGRGSWQASISEKNFSAELEGFTREPVSARAVKGNRFSIVLRDMSEPEVRAVVHNLPSVRDTGIPNYYDEQRFGSARHGGGFMGKAIFLGRREEALKLYFLPSKHDDQKTRKLKKCVTANWGKWDECLALAFGQYGRVLSYLAEHPRAHHKALSLIDRRFLVFVANAYQSLLFNRVLSRYIEGLSKREDFPLRRVATPYCDYLFPIAMPAALVKECERTLLPVPGYDSVIGDPTVRAIVAEVLEEEEIRLEDLRIRQMQRMSAHGVERAALVQAGDLSDAAVSDDELYPGRKKVAISFFLPRGSYATILIKRIVLATGPQPERTAASPDPTVP